MTKRDKRGNFSIRINNSTEMPQLRISEIQITMIMGNNPTTQIPTQTQFIFMFIIQCINNTQCDIWIFWIDNIHSFCL